MTAAIPRDEWLLERGKWETIVATDKSTVGRAVKEDCREEIANFA